MTTLNFPNSPSVNDTYQFNNLVFVFDGTKWKVDGQLSYIQDAIQFVRSGTQAERPTVSAPSLYYNTDLEGLEFYYPDIDTWEVVSTFAKQVDPTQDSGQIAYTQAGTYSFVCPANVFQVHVVCVGGGGNGFLSTNGPNCGGGGGGLAWRNNISVTPGESYAVQVGGIGGSSWFINSSTVSGFGGTSAINSQTGGGAGGGFFTVIGPGGGGFGGRGGNSFSTPAGGGGAGGYTGNGGEGAISAPSNSTGFAGTGGGAGGGGSSASTSQGSGRGGAGGGVGILGAGSSGAGGTGGADRGGGGSGGQGGSTFANGGLYGGGGAGSTTSVSVSGGGGAVRIIWGPNRSFPSTNTGDV